jgi:hypothetical protein
MPERSGIFSPWILNIVGGIFIPIITLHIAQMDEEREP